MYNFNALRHSIHLVIANKIEFFYHLFLHESLQSLEVMPVYALRRVYFYGNLITDQKVYFSMPTKGAPKS